MPGDGAGPMKVAPRMVVLGPASMAVLLPARVVHSDDGELLRDPRYEDDAPT
jgi:hypothetical protein